MHTHSFQDRVTSYGNGLRRHCEDNGFDSYKEYLPSIHRALREQVERQSVSIGHIALAVSDPYADYDATQKERIRRGLVMGLHFFISMLEKSEFGLLKKRLKEDANWMSSLPPETDVRHLLDRVAPNPSTVFPEGSQWLRDDSGDEDPDFMAGVMYMYRLAEESALTAAIAAHNAGTISVEERARVKKLADAEKRENQDYFKSPGN